MAFIFISYARADRTYVDKLAAHLARAGLKTWYDYDIEAGTDWSREVEAKIEACAAMIVVMTPTAARSPMVGVEVQLAMLRNKLIVPLLLAGQPMFLLLGTQYEDVTHGVMPSARAAARLRTALRNSGSTQRVAMDGGTIRFDAPAAPSTHAVGPAEDLLERFGSMCPVCFAPLGGHVDVDPDTRRFERPPSLRLLVGPAERSGRFPWQVSVSQERYPALNSVDPPFDRLSAADDYLLCGDGHFFPVPTIPSSPSPPKRRSGRWQRLWRDDARPPSSPAVERWNMVGLVGAPASGKTYLIVRALSQSLNDDLLVDDPGPLVRRAGAPLEALALTRREVMYRRTLGEGIPVVPTSAMGEMSADTLSDLVPDAYEAIKEVIRRTVRHGDQWAATWGQVVRQPIVLRADVRGRRTWTGIADFPGEMFQTDGLDAGPSRVQRAKLRAYDALVWAVDPAVSRQTSQWLGLTAPGVLDGSLRPGSGADAAKVQLARDQIQHNIGRSLSFVDGPFVDAGPARTEMLIALTKSDLIRDALAAGRRLDDLGSEVVAGTASFLLALARRYSNQEVKCDAAGHDLLMYVMPGPEPSGVSRNRARQIAEALIAHYSDANRFWNLVHTGTADTIRVPADRLDVLGHEIDVPAIGSHVRAANSTPSVQLLRDILMSAVGTGLVCGAGLQGSLYELLAQPHLNARVFLCSALVAVPVADHGGIRPRNTTARFPELDEPSAGLTQLVLAMLAKVRQG